MNVGLRYLFVATVVMLATILACLYPSPLLDLGFLIRHNVWSAFVCSPLILWAAVGRRSRLSRTSWYVIWCLTFLLSLLGTWHQGVTDAATIGGLIQLNDAGDYYTSARRLIEGYRFSDVASSRPLSTGFLSFVLWLSHGDLKTTLLLLCLVCSLFSCLFVEECRKSLGNAAAVYSGTLVFVFYNRFIGTTGTEQLGLMFALIGTALLLKAASSVHVVSAWFGLFLVMLALITRAGALFVLPALVVWVALVFKGTGGGVSWRNALPAVFGTALAFYLNWVLFKVVGSSGQPPFGNFAFVLFGLVTGGKGWVSAYAAHPELVQLPFNVQCREIYSLAWQEFSRRPSLTLVGAVRYIGEFVEPSGSGMFGFVVAHRFTNVEHWGVERTFNVGTRAILVGLSAWGIGCCWMYRRHPSYSLVLSSAAGIVASVPFVPPVDTDQTRAYAATIPFIAVIASLGVAAALRRFRGMAFVLQPRLESRGWAWIALLGAGLTVASLGGPVLVKSLAAPKRVPPAVCPDGQSAHYFRVSHATEIRLATAGASQGRRFLDVLDVMDGTRVFVVMPDAVTRGAWQGDELSAVCGVNGTELGYPVFDAYSIHPVKHLTSR